MEITSPVPTFVDQFRGYAIVNALLSIVKNKAFVRKARARFRAYCAKAKREGKILELLPLLEDRFPAVQLTVATQLLDDDPKSALPVIETIARGPNTKVRAHARRVLRRWQREAQAAH